MKQCAHLLAVIDALAGVPAVGKMIVGTASVIDGDTLEIHGQRIRLSTIDAIESRQSCILPDGRHWSCGRDAAKALSDKIGRVPPTCAVAYRRYGLGYVSQEDHARKAGLGIWTSQFDMRWDWRKANQ